MDFDHEYPQLSIYLLPYVPPSLYLPQFCFLFLNINYLMTWICAVHILRGMGPFTGVWSTYHEPNS